MNVSASTNTAASNGGLIARVYGLLDAESANLLGAYATEQAALQVVAGLAQRYGVASSAVANLVLYRNDVPEDESVISEGEPLVQRALEADGALGPDRLAPHTSEPGVDQRPAARALNR